MDTDLLISYLDEVYTGAWGGDDSPDVDNLDTLLALQALRKINYPDQDIISTALYNLTSNQNSDSGWGFRREDDSEVYYTALVLQTLSQFKSTYDLQTPIVSVATYLHTKQNIDGGFGSSTSTVYETALSVLALINSGVSDQQSAISIQNAINYLVTTQFPNGSWNDDPYSTALALRALANVKPNLTITASDITFTPAYPTAGDTITIKASVHNTGSADASNVLVRFYDGDPNAGGSLIGETIIASIPAYGSDQATINYTIPAASSKAVFVSLDPLNTIDELSETDNVASKNLTSATLPDLSITTADITMYPSNPDPNMSVSVLVRVRNHGETDVQNIPVDIYDGDPSSGGVRLQGSGLISLIPAGSFADIAAVIDGSRVAAGMKTITALVDQTNLITESDKTNNSASKTFRVGGLFPDLNLFGAIISYEPLYPQEKSFVTFTVPVDNRGEAEAGNVLVRFYLGDPDSGGTKIGSDAVIPAIAAGGKAYATVTWDTTGRKGKNLIFIKVDPLNTVQESNEQNNKISISMDVAATTGSNLMVSSGEITFAPVSPVSGDIVTISAVIRNNTNQTVNNVVVEFSDGDPRVSGTRIIGQMTITTLKGGAYGSVTIQIPWNTAGLTGRHNIYVNVDPFNEIIEIDEKDNIAYAAVDIRDIQKPDLTVLSIDKTGLLTDLQMLTVSGHVRATIQNKGNQPSVEPFEITAFEDLNKNKTLEGDTDNVLGTVSYSGSLAPGASDTIDIPVSGTVLFRDSLISVMVDSGNTVSEADETNNVRNTGKQCSSEPSCGKWDVVEKFSWTGSPVYPGLTNVYSVPLVAHLTDDNGDGVIDDNDTPSILFHTEGPIRVISGADGHELFTVKSVDYWLMSSSHFAVGDIDNDGKVDIVGLTLRGTPAIIALNNDGSLKWKSPRI